MAASTWRLRRLWTIETSLFNKTSAKRTELSPADRLSGAFSQLASTPDLHLLDRYETRLHRMYQRSLTNILTLRQMPVPGEENGEDDRSDNGEDDREENGQAADREPADLGQSLTEMENQKFPNEAKCS